MTWVFSKLHMGLWKKFAFLSLLLLLLLHWKTPAAGIGKISTSSQMISVRSSQNGIRGEDPSSDQEKADDVFGSEKRKVYTGPNPLHNR